MDERRLRVTVDESRHLFQNLLREAHGSYRDVFPEAAESAAAGDGGAGDANWQAVEQEIRAAYEMSRFALNVVDLPSTDDIDDFRGFCEDVDGLEPLDRSLLNSVGRLCVQINDQLLANSEYRRKIPRVVERSFKTYVGKKQDYYDQLLSQAAPDPSGTGAEREGALAEASSPVLAEKIPPEVLLQVISELAQRVQSLAELLESV